MNDRRVKYTHMVLQQALLKLMETKPLPKIQIKEICDLADVNRGTFYNHYNDQYDLLDQIQDEFAAEVMDLWNKRQSNVMDAQTMLTELLAYIADQRALCKILFKTASDNDLITRLTNIACASVKEQWRQHGGDLTEWQADMLYRFIADGGATIIRHWAVDDMNVPPSELAQFILRAMNHGSDAFTRQPKHAG